MTDRRDNDVNNEEKALRFNEGKPKLSELLYFANALEDLAAVCSQGAIKYDSGNWLKGGKPLNEYLDSAMRHLVKAKNGELYDADSGNKHMAHVAWNCLAALRLIVELQGESIDPLFDQEAFEKKYL